MAEGEKAQLLSMWSSPYVMIAQVALELKGVPYEMVPQDLSNKSDLLLQSNPVYKTVPVLLHNGRVICESLLIVQYVDETWPSPEGANLLPADAYGRAKGRFWADFLNKKMEEPVFGALKASVNGSEEQKKEAEEKLVSLLSNLEEALVGQCAGPFFGGKRMGLADVMAVSLVTWFPAVEDLAHLSIPWSEKLPKLQATLAAIRAHPAAVKLPEPAKIKDYINSHVIQRLQQA